MQKSKQALPNSGPPKATNNYWSAGHNTSATTEAAGSDGKMHRSTTGKNVLNNNTKIHKQNLLQSPIFINAVSGGGAE